MAMINILKKNQYYCKKADIEQYVLHNYIAHQFSNNKMKLVVSCPKSVVSSAAGFRFIGNNRIISFVLIKYKKIFSHAATKKKSDRKACIVHVQSNVLLVQNLLEFVWLCFKLSNEINRKDISFLFSFLDHYLKKVKCSATRKASSNNYLTWTLHAVYMWLKVERSTLQFTQLNLLK